MSRVFSADASSQYDWRWVQTALGRILGRDIPRGGLPGPITRTALRDFRDLSGLGPGGLDDSLWREIDAALTRMAPAERPRIAVLRPSREREELKERGPQSHGVDVHARYLSAGFAVDLIENPLRADLESWALTAVDEGRVPDLVHVSASLDTSGASVYLDFGASEPGHRRRGRSGRAEEMFVTTLDRVLQLLSGWGRPPIVVLDVARPRANTEAARHLVLRNEFASQLFSLDNTPVVLAVGPASPAAQARACDVLVASLAAGRSVGQACQSIRALATSTGVPSSDRLDDLLAFAAAALFAHRASARPGRAR